MPATATACFPRLQSPAGTRCLTLLISGSWLGNRDRRKARPLYFIEKPGDEPGFSIFNGGQLLLR
jgi:hypothetical protein